MLGTRTRPAFVLVVCMSAFVASVALGRLSAARNGLVGQYYSNPGFAGAPFLTTVDAQPSTELIAERWGAFPPPAFSVAWTGYLTVGRSAPYGFAVTSDDGSRLFIDRQLVVDNSGNHGPATQSGRIHLDRGSHQIRLEHSESGGGYVLSWAWDETGNGYQPVPAWRLSREEVAPVRAMAERVARIASPFFAVAALLAALWTFRPGWRRVVDVAAMGAVIVGALPWQPVVRTGYYEYQVHLGFVERLQWGVDVACTYGPWGFVGLPLFHPSTFPWMLLINLVILVITAARVFVFVHRVRPAAPFPGVWSAAVILPLSVIAVPEWSAVLFSANVIALAMSLEWICEREARFTAVDAAAAVALGFLMLVKLSVWPLAPLIIGSAFLHSRRHGIALTAWLAAAAFGAWVGAAQALGNLPAFLEVSLEIITGFKNEMATWRQSSDAAALFLVTSAILLALIAWASPPRRRERWLIFLVPAAVFFQLFQAAFVRADRQHMFSSVLAMCALALLVVAVVVRGRGFAPLLRGAIVAGLFVMLLRATPGLPDYRRPRVEWSAFVNLLDRGTDPFVVTRLRWFAEVRASHPLPIETMDGAVAVWAGDIGILEANGVRVAVQPTLTSYAAYTADLQLLNQHWLERPSVRWVVWCGPTTVDDRYPSESDSKALLYLASHFSFSNQVRDCSLLRRTEAAGWTAQKEQEQRVAFNERVAVTASEGALVWAEISAPETLPGRLLAAALKPVPLRLRTFLKDGTIVVHPITPSMTRLGFVLSPYAADWRPLAAVAAGQTSGKQVVGIEVDHWDIGQFTSAPFYRPEATVRLTPIVPPSKTAAR